eukprot:CAMPEP_0198714370 /NCGR_PEP_ID=MMETSP1471-20131121/20077_1 /TAXON_ID=41880 /ORGANISM="Pycnococcus provasolii, Strain RCC733" /LENGTH=69 /DNA_ID=CAMNT_0044474657 /DNA_START=52 /DNA_END=258 /DNA_ORIENTATION=-
MPSGGAWPELLLPQHAILPSTDSAKECAVPAAIATKLPGTPSGGAWPIPLNPQHAILPSTRSANECSSP